MAMRRWGFPVLLLVAGFALWLLLAGPSKLLGIDTGQAGTALLVTVAWVSLLAIQKMPRGDFERAVSPGEWKAWSGLVFMAVAILYFLSKRHVFQGAAIPYNPEAAAVGRNLVLLLVAWTVLSRVIASRRKDEVQEDERDREIARQAVGWGRGALGFCVVAIAVTLAFSPGHRLEWATHLMIANMLVFALMWGCLFEYAAAAVAYWRDRH
jgi:uncharacterized membrane protein